MKRLFPQGSVLSKLLRRWGPKGRPARKERVLFATTVPAFSIPLQLDFALAQELQRLGHEAALSICDGALEACHNCKFTHLDRPEELLGDQWKVRPLTCGRCHGKRSGLTDDTVRQIAFSDFDVESEVAEFTTQLQALGSDQLEVVEASGIPLYEHAFAGTARFFAKGNPRDEATFDGVLRKYLVAAFRTLSTYERIFREFQPTVVVSHHGIYVPQGVIVDLAKKHGVRVVTYNTGYREGSFLFAHGDTYHKVLPKESGHESRLSDEKASIIVDYLKSRRLGKNDWIYYNRGAEEELNIRKRFSIGPDARILTVFSNVYWDAQLHFPENIYPDMMSWLQDTISFAGGLDRVHCIVRAHPAEVNGFVPARQQAVDELRKSMEIPSNVTLIAAGDDVDSYQLAEQSDLVIVYATKMAGELSALGKRVIVCGDAWAKGKGFTSDPRSVAEYKQLIEQLLSDGEELDPERVDMALGYCYDFFFRRSIQLEFAGQNDKSKKISIAYPGAATVRREPEQFPGLRAICDGILHETDFKSTVH